jgi:hypothetical protein
MAERPSDQAASTAAAPPAAPPTDEVSFRPAPVPTARPAPGRVALLVYAVCVAVYALFAWERLPVHSPDNHFSYLADSYLHGTLSVRCAAAEEARGTCPPGGGGNDWARYGGRWYVAFPSFPAVVYMPPVALLGRDFPNRAYDVLLAGVAPALLYLLLEKLSRKGRSPRSWRENLAFTALFAFGTVYFFTAVQGSVWFTAHVISTALVVGYLWWGLDLENPFLAGVCLALAIHTRADLVYAAPFYALEALRVCRRPDAPAVPAGAGLATRVRAWLAGVEWPRALRALVLFALPVAAAVGLSLLLNKLRFGDAREVGYRYLQIRWRDRIERWGLFNYHYLSRNLAIMLASLPWITREFPYVVISRHGLALWFTTPHYLELMRLRRRPGDPYTPFLALTAAAVALSVLLYQNSGWVQFGYRFSNDFAVFLMLLLAINGRRVGRLWLAALAFAIAVNAFGAATFGREVVLGGRRISFEDNDTTQQRYFQPD